MIRKLSHNKFTKVTYISILTITLLSLLASTLSFQVYAKSAYDSGYSHGCSDAGLSFSDRYINQPEKGPSFHTGDFMDGYNTGISSCSGGSDNNSNNPSSSSGSDTVGKLLCYGAGGLAILEGAPVEGVLGAGQAAHQAGICP